MVEKLMSDRVRREMHERQRLAEVHADDMRINMRQDIRYMLARSGVQTVAQLMPVDDEGRTELTVKRDGADYVFSKIGYVDSRDPSSLLAKRMIANINRRTELAYWSARAQPKQLTVHFGLGTLVFARLNADYLEEVALNAENSNGRQARLPGGAFYTFEAAPADSLVVSGFYEAPFKEWSDMEQEFLPGETTVRLGDEEVTVPAVFAERFSSAA